MPNTQTLKSDLDQSESLRLVTESLSEVAALEFKHTRNEIQHNKIFFRDLSKIYRAIEALAEKKSVTEDIKSIKNGKTISLLITSNYHLYGGLDSNLSHFFHQTTSRYATDRIIVGSSGISYLKSLDPSGRYQVFIPKGNLPTGAEIKALTAMIQNYSRILVYYSKFISILRQQVDVSSLSGEKETDKKLDLKVDYILEPELPKLITFFEAEIVGSILNSFFLQAQLSRTAARMVGMDQAEINTTKLIKKQRLNLLQMKRMLQNLRVMEAFPVIKELENE